MWNNNVLSEDYPGLKLRNALSHNLLKTWEREGI